MSFMKLKWRGLLFMNIAQLIKEVRNNSGLSLKEFAKPLGVTAESVRLWESGKYKPSSNTR